MKVKYKGKEYRLGPGWDRTRFTVLKAEAGIHANIIILNDKGERQLVPITDCEWIGE